MNKPKPIEELTVAELFDLIERIREEHPESEDLIQQHISIEVGNLRDVFIRTTSENSYARYQLSTIFYNGLHYPVLHNLWTGRTRTIMGNTEKNLITAQGYKDRPYEWTYAMLEQACRHHEGLVPGNLKFLCTGDILNEFLLGLD